MKIRYEVCCGCAEDAIQAEKGGADRVELNNALFLGGLTPSLGTLQEVKRQVKLPVMCMVRPREGGFCYTEPEFRTMLADAAALVRAGADGIVFGILYPDGTVDVPRCRQLMDTVRRENPNTELVFHRAIDVTPDLLQALDALLALGVDRVLTSGQAPTAPAGAENIRTMRAYVNGKLEILPGGGLNSENIADFVRQTGVTQVHSSARSLRADTSVRNRPQITFGGTIHGMGIAEDEYKVTDHAKVAATVAALEKVGKA